MSQLSWTEFLKVKDLTEEINQGFGVLNAEGKFEYANAKLAQILDYTQEEVKGRSYHDLFKMDGTDFVLDDTFSKKDVTLLSKKNIKCTAKITIRKLEDPNHRWYLLVSDCTDFGYRLDSEFLKAIDLASPHRLVVGRDLQIQYISKPFTGFDDDYYIGRSALDGVDPEYRDGLRDAIEAVFEDGGVGSIEISTGDDTEHTRWVTLRISPIIQDNVITAVVITSTDITERVHTEIALRESEERFRGIIENANDGIILTDTKGQITYVNEPFLRIFGMKRYEIIGKYLWEVQSYLATGSMEVSDYQVEVKSASISFFETGKASWLGKVTKGEFTHLENKSIVYYEQQAFKIPSSEGPMLCSFVWNATEKTLREQALRKSEQLYRSLFEQNNDAVFILDLDGRHIHVNQKASDLLGYSTDELMQMGLSETVVEREVDDSRDRIKDLLEGKSLPIYERTMRRKNGEDISVEINVSLIRDDEGKPLHIQSIVRDISEKQRTLQSMKESEERLELALRGADLGVWDWDTEKDELRFDERYLGILGFTPEEIGTDYHRWESLIHPDDLAIMEERWNSHVAGLTPFYSSEHRMRTKNGEYRWVLERGKVVEKTESGGTKRATGTLLDITERVLAEQMLREEESKYKTIVEQSLVGIAILPGGPVNIVFSNKQLSAMLGYTPSELQSMDTETIVSLVVEDDREELQTYLRAALRETTKQDFIETRFTSKFQQEICVQLSAGKIEYKGEPAILLSMVDITKRKEIEDGLRESEVKGHTLLQSLNDLVIVYDKNDFYAETFTGNPDLIFTEQGDFIGKHISEVLPESVASMFLDNFQKVRASKETISFDYPLEMSDVQRWFSANMSLHEDKKSIVVVIRDITARYKAEQTLRRDRHVFRDLAQTFVESTDISELTHNILQILIQSYEFDLGLFTKYEPSENILLLSASQGSDEDLLPKIIDLNEDASSKFLLAYVFRSKQPLFISDIAASQQTRPYLGRVLKLGANSVIAIPILDDTDNVVAVTSFATRRKRDFTESDRELFTTIGRMLGTALERRKAEEDRKQAQDSLARERKAFQSIASAAVATSDTMDLSTSILEGIIQSLGLDFGTLRLYDDKEHVLQSSALFGIDTSRLASIIPCNFDQPAKHLVSQVAISNEKVIASDVNKHPTTLLFKERLEELGVKSVVVWPILDEKEQLLGVLSIGAYEKIDISDTTEIFFDALAGMLSTIIQRMKTEKALLISERRYRDLLTDMSEGIGMADLEERLVFVNESFAEMLGYSQDELIGTSLLDLVSPEDIQLIVNQTTLRKDGRRSSYTHSFIRRDGEKRIVRVSAVPSRDSEGEIDGSVAIVTDITEQLQAEAALKESEVRFRNIFNSSPVGMHLIEQADDGQLILIDANPAADKMLRADHDDYYGKPLSYSMEKRSDLDVVLSAYDEVIRTGKTWSHEDIQYENDQIQSAMQVQAFRTSARTLVVSFLDVTEQVIAERALKESEARFRSIFETTPVGMHLVEMSDTGELILVDENPAAKEMEERAREDRFKIGQPIKYEITGMRGQVVVDRFKDILRTGIPWKVEDEYYDKDRNPIGAVQLQIFRASPHTIVTSFLDISERYLAEQQIRKLNEELATRVDERTAELAAANKELEAFAYSVSHDLRAPLRSIDGFSQALLEDYADQIDETGKDYLQRVRAGASRMGALIEDILSLSRVTRSDMVRTDVHLSQIVREILKEKTEANPDREIDMRVDEVISARCDSRLIRIALQNLIDNAWKFTRITEHPRITFGSKEIDGKTAYFIRDNGAGFDMKYKEKLFTPFQRLHSSDEFEGSGIGLATVQRIINRHGGHIWAESEIGNGTTFYFTIPM